MTNQPGWTGTTYTGKNGRQKNYYRRKREQDFRYGLLESTRTNARRVGCENTITIDDLDLPEKCPVLGLDLDYELFKGHGPMANRPTVDRLNPALGYVPGNVRVISHKANRFKNNMTLEEAELVLKYMRENYAT